MAEHLDRRSAFELLDAQRRLEWLERQVVEQRQAIRILLDASSANFDQRERLIDAMETACVAASEYGVCEEEGCGHPWCGAYTTLRQALEEVGR